MLFPKVEQRVRYDKMPLVEVICQIRYPAILRIGAYEPVEFQEKIRNLFPNFREAVASPVPRELAQVIRSDVAGSLVNSTKAYEFVSLDNKWVVSLTRDFLALTCSEYTIWEDFLKKLTVPYNALCEIYHPSTLNRVGLRYKNVIQRSVLGLEQVEWQQLINPVLAGFLASSEQKNAVEETNHVTLFNSGEELGKIRIIHGFTRNNKTQELCYLIDNDFFIEGLQELDNGLDTITSFNRRNRNLFRWCISDRLHKSMDPKEI